MVSSRVKQQGAVLVKSNRPGFYPGDKGSTPFSLTICPCSSDGRAADS